MNKSYRIILLIILLSFINLFAQKEISFDRISLLEGLSNPTILKVMQDQFGYIWIGTNDGLNKYDGYQFSIYREDNEVPNSLKGSIILDILEDKTGNLWIATDKALNLYNRDLDNFESFQIDSTSEQQFFNAVICLLEDSKGELWTGKVYHGLTKFDRLKKSFVTAKLDSTLKPYAGYGVFDMAEDNMGRIWYVKGQSFYQKSNIVVVDKERKKETDYTDKLTANSGQNVFLTKISTDIKKNIYLQTNTGYIVKVNPADLSCESASIMENATISNILNQGTEISWVGTLENGLIKYDWKTNEKQVIVNIPNNENSIASNFITEIFIDSTGVFWIGTNNAGINKFDPNKTSFSLYKIPIEGKMGEYSYVSGFSNSKVFPNTIWVSTANGLFQFNEITKNLTNVSQKYKFKKDTPLRSVLEDSKTNLWLGSADSGVIKINLKENKTTVFTSDPNDPSTISNNSIRTIYEDPAGRIWIGTFQGLNLFNPSDNSFRRYRTFDTTFTGDVFKFLRTLRKSEKTVLEINRAKDLQKITKKFSLPAKKKLLVTSIGEKTLLGSKSLWDYGWIEDEKGKVVWRFDSLDNKHAGGAIKNRIVVNLIELNAGTYYLNYKTDDSHSFSAWNDAPPADPDYWGVQIYKLTPEDEKYIKPKLSIIQIDKSIPGENIRVVYGSDKNKIWIGTNNSGFASYDIAADEFNQIGEGGQDLTGLSSKRVNSIIQDKKGRLWVATFGGLLMLNKNGSESRTFTTNSGLPTNYLMDLMEDQLGNIWISSVKGLIKFTPDEKLNNISFITYDTKDGLQDYSFFQGASLKGDNGRLYFGGEKGFNSFYPSKINTTPPLIVINMMQISNKTVTPSSDNTPLQKGISLTESITLPYSQNDFSFEFTAIHFSRPEKNKYAYFLEGFDEDWIYDNRRFASYTNLDPGQYTFKIKAANADGVWSINPKILKITILPPWWQTTYAYISYGFVILLFLFGFDRFQRRRILNKEREKQKIQEAELRALAAEAQARLIEAENERKTKELEEARNLQLSMLPHVLPELPNLDIAVYMKTATEVGGDYYDFHVGLDGTLTVVIGDATGHGLNAGTIVTATKSLFSSHASNPDIVYTFSEISRCLKEMKFRLLSMCLQILKIRGNNMYLSAAGMPPVLIYRRSTNNVEELLIKGMPLGTPASFPYEVKTSTLNSGDTILLMSDGFPELFNESKEMYGYERIERKFLEIADLSPDNIIAELIKSGDKWSNGREQDDDISFVVIKVK
jgi:serine phosphatase RsbU (regulator of sigma subunit)/ligand-binding sensor domain-containing protein